MTPEAIKLLITELVDPAARVVSEISTKAFQLALLQNQVYIYQNAIVAGVAFALMVVALVTLFVHYQKNKAIYDLGYICMIVAAVSLALVVVESMFIVPRVINPEYMAIKDVVHVLQGNDQ